MEEYEPLCAWECFACQRQFLLKSQNAPIVCPFCFQIDSIVFLDNVEENQWRPNDTEGDLENGESKEDWR